MEAIQQRLAKLTVDELRAEVKSCEQKPIPITQTTRALVERRLAKYLWEQHGGVVMEENKVDETLTRSPEKPVQLTTASFQDEGANRMQGDANAIPNKQNSQAHPAGGVVKNYFAICIPPKSESTSVGGDDIDSSRVVGSSDEVLIYQDRREALSIARKNKGARFKVFKTKEEAESFAKTHQDLSTPKVSTEPASNQSVAEKPVSTYRSVKPQDLVALRKTIESNDVVKFRELAWSNPRYLINAGDNPTILQEGSRYNALHIAAKENRPEICMLVLETIQDSIYILMMYPDDPHDTLINRRKYLVDLYLNSPEKGNGETPLHFACKFGHIEVAEILVDHSQCDKTLKNKHGETAEEVVCSRSSLSGTALKQRETTISDLLHDHYYVPVYRAEDNCTQPVIGEPWSPDLSEHQSSPLFHGRRAPESPVDSVLSLQAYAGPMSPAEAECFRRNLHTPPSTERKRVGRIKRADGEKGVERIGRELASKMRVSWAEYWSFMDAFVDLASPLGLQKLEEYLVERCNGMNEDKVELRMPTVEQEKLRSFAPAGTVMKDLVGEFEKLTISGAENGVKTTDSTEEMQTDRNKEGQPSCSGTDSAQEGATKSQVTLECRKASNASSKMNHDHYTSNAVGFHEMNTNNGTPAEMQPGDSLSQSVGKTEISSTSPDLQKRATAAHEHPSHDGDENWVEDSNKCSVDSLKIPCRSEVSLQVERPLCSDVMVEEEQDLDLEGRAQLSDAACTKINDSTTTGHDENRKAQESSSVSGHDVLHGSCTPRTVNEDGGSLKREHLAAGDQRSDEERMASSVTGNGDRKGRIFCTPKMVSSRRVNSSFRSVGQAKVSFILGSQPTKTDLNVWRALAEVEVPDKYPCIRQWKQLVSSVPGETRDRWPTPARCEATRHLLSHTSQTSSPRHLRAGLGAPIDGSPLGFRARHFSEPTHRSRELAGSLRLQQAKFDIAESFGELKARLFQE